MAGPFNGHGIDLERGIEQEGLFGDPYIQLLLKHLHDPNLFYGTPEDSRKRQQELLIPFLDFFRRHDKGGYYTGLFRRKGLLDESASEARLRTDIVLEDLVKLRTHSDDLRGNGQHRKLIREIDPDNPPVGSQIHSSSGTTQSVAGPVSILRSPMTIQLVRIVNSGLVKWGVGHSLDGSYCMLQVAPEMTDYVTFASFGADAMRILGCDVVFGNKLNNDVNEPNVWRRLTPDRHTMKRFFTARQMPKYLITSSTGLFNTISNQNSLKRVAIRMTLGIPPIHLGTDGILMTGGGLKRVPTCYQTMRDFIIAMSPNIVANYDGQVKPALIMDYLGLTESASIFVNQAAEPGSEKAWIKYPHPLTYLATLESAEDLTPVPGGQFDKSRLLFYVNFTCIDYLEAIVSGDFIKRIPTPAKYQHGFVYDHRASAAEGFQIREGCG